MNKDINIKAVIEETYNLSEESKEIDARIKSNKKVLQQYFDENEDDLFSNSITTENGIKATKVTSAYITYDGVKLERNLKKNNKKDYIERAIKKVYTIVDIQAFIQFVKLANITPHGIKRHLKIDRIVQKDTVKRMFENGELTKEDLDGCMDTKLVDSIRITKIKS